MVIFSHKVDTRPSGGGMTPFIRGELVSFIRGELVSRLRSETEVDKITTGSAIIIIN